METSRTINLSFSRMWDQSKNEQIMKVISKISLVVLVSFVLVSCQFNGNFSFGEKGNGNVIKEDRTISESFNWC